MRMRTRAVGVLLTALGFTMAGATSEAAPAPAARPAKPKPARFADTPCAGCRAVLPPPSGDPTAPIPLLVVLHGDWGLGPGDMLASWERHALAKGVGVLALQCPRDQGCKGSWWQWNGEPSWVTAQVDALATSSKRAFDRDRLFLAGWSGGATYIGLRAQTLERTFAGLVYHGGGMAPFDSTCHAQGSAFFLTGTGNPLHSHVVGLRRFHEACNDDVTWKVLPGADHTAEWKALDAHGGAIVDWLLTKRRASLKAAVSEREPAR